MAYMVKSFMIKELNLSGNDLIIFAFLYSATFNGCKQFIGNISTISSKTNTSEKTVKRSLDKIKESGFISKKVINLHNEKGFTKRIVIKILTHVEIPLFLNFDSDKDVSMKSCEKHLKDCDYDEEMKEMILYTISEFIDAYNYNFLGRKTHPRLSVDFLEHDIEPLYNSLAEYDFDKYQIDSLIEKYSEDMNRFDIEGKEKGFSVKISHMFHENNIKLYVERMNQDG